MAKVGGAPVTLEVAQALVGSAREIISKIRDWIPADLHWPEFKHRVQVEARKRLS